MEAKKLALGIAESALEKLAEAVEIINVKGKVDYADYVVICSGRSERQVEAIVSSIESTLKHESVYPLGVEGKQASTWVLMDYDDVIVHVFVEEQRGFYDLDSLWIDADRIPVRQVPQKD